MNYYVGHPLQTRGAEQYTLRGGKGEGLNFLCVRNGLGLEAWVAIDRAGDLYRVNYKGDNMGFFSPCGNVSPQYYDHQGLGFLKSFTAGFFTTCGLTTVGTPCNDEGEELPLHGNIANIPAEVLVLDEDDEGLTVKLRVRDAVLFGRKYILNRTYTFSYTENSIKVSDTVENTGDTAEPYMILYHCNMGYPLLTENSIFKVPHDNIVARSEEAQKHIDSALKMEKPQANFEERCYFFDMKEKGGVTKAGLYNPDINKGVVFSYNKEQLPHLTEWKMMGKTDYVLGIEPGNCQPGKRTDLKKNGIVKYLAPEQKGTTALKFTFVDDQKTFEGEF